MEGRLKYGQGRTRGTPWAASLALEKHKSEESGRIAFHNEWTEEGSVLDVTQRSRLRIGSVNVGMMAKTSGEVMEMAEREIWTSAVCRSQDGRVKGPDSSMDISIGRQERWEYQGLAS